MTDKQIIDKLKNDVACKESIINHLAEHNIKLQAQLKCKEQECERLKYDNDYEVGTLEKTIDNLTVENDTYRNKAEKFRQALAEIKELIEICNCHNADGCYECKYFDDCEVEGEEIPTRDVCKLILQKISEAKL